MQVTHQPQAFLFGGALAGRTANHNLVTAIGIAVTGGVSLLIAFVDPGAFLLVLVISVSGFASGMAMPSRDMIVRASTPPGATGRVYGFVYSGLDLGSLSTPVFYGWLMDHHLPHAVFFAVAAFSIVSMLTVLQLPGRKPATQRT